MSPSRSSISDASTAADPAWSPSKTPKDHCVYEGGRAWICGRRIDANEQKAGEEDENVVNWRENDPENPRNWPEWKKWMVIVSILIVDQSVSFGSTGYSAAQTKFSEDMRVSKLVAVLPLSAFLFGYGLDPLILAWGSRKPVYIIGSAIMTIWTTASAVAPNLDGFLALRFLGGFIGAMSCANIGGSISDLWAPTQTAPAMSAYVATAAGGPGLAYAPSSMIFQFRPWRHLMWAISGIQGGTLLILVVLQRETRHSILLERRLKKLKKETGNDKLHLPAGMEHKGWGDLLKNNLLRPLQFEVTEPICFAAALINVQLFGLNYLLTGAYPLVFGDNGGRTWNTLQVGMVWFSLVAGVWTGPITHTLQERKFRQLTREHGGILVPERRLGMACVAGIVYPVSLFWFAWTSYPSVHWFVPALATYFFGWSFFALIHMVNMYLTDSYGEFAASAIAASTLARNLAGAGFPLFGTQMYQNLGYQWASTLLAFLGLIVTTIPFFFLRYGKWLRRKSPFARKHMEEMGEDIEDGKGREA
ncbi:hypothetical protein JCM8547_002634 [Rhodosporidiobolus lusitaniae]